MAQSPKRRLKTEAPRPKVKTDDELLGGARSGDRSAFLELFVRQLPALERFVRREVRYLENIGAIEYGLIDAHAVVDQVYIASIENLKRMSPEVTFRGWLRYLAHHILNQHARVEHEEEPAGLTLERLAPAAGDVDTALWEYYQPDDVLEMEDTVSDGSANSPQEMLEGQEAYDEVQDKLALLPAEQREFFVLRVFEGLSVDEIAAMKKRPPTIIRQAIHDARESLRSAGVNQ